MKAKKDREGLGSLFFCLFMFALFCGVCVCCTFDVMQQDCDHIFFCVWCVVQVAKDVEKKGTTK